MPGNEKVARRFLDFIEAARQKASGGGFQTQVGQMRSSPPKTPLEQLYEKGMAELADDERDALVLHRR